MSNGYIKNKRNTPYFYCRLFGADLVDKVCNKNTMLVLVVFYDWSNQLIFNYICIYYIMFIFVIMLKFYVLINYFFPHFPQRYICMIGGLISPTSSLSLSLSGEFLFNHQRMGIIIIILLHWLTNCSTNSSFQFIKFVIHFRLHYKII